LNLDGQTGIDESKGEFNRIVYFKWGSLVAVSAPTSGTSNSFGVSGDNNDIAWVPEGFDPDKPITAYSAGDNSKGYMTVPFAGKYQYSSYVFDYSDYERDSNPNHAFPAQTPDNTRRGLGDPCRFAVKRGAQIGDYRMPDMITRVGHSYGYYPDAPVSRDGVQTDPETNLEGRFGTAEAGGYRQFYPFAGNMNSSGAGVFSPLTDGWFWAANWVDNRSRVLKITHTASSGDGTIGSRGDPHLGYPIRCIPVTD
jgi:hypothetical protein